MNTTISKIDTFRMWSDNEDLDFAWLVAQFRKEEKPTEQQLAGLALHRALEAVGEEETEALVVEGYIFEFLKDFSLELGPFRECPVTKDYGELTLHGRVDHIDGLVLTDYKSTDRFDHQDADRLMAGYQWRYYLDMTGSHTFRWKVFVLRSADAKEDEEEDEQLTLGQPTPKGSKPRPHLYIVTDIFNLEQRRYPELGADCAHLAQEYVEFMKVHGRTIYAPREPSPEPSLVPELEASLEMARRKRAENRP